MLQPKLIPMSGLKSDLDCVAFMEKFTWQSSFDDVKLEEVAAFTVANVTK